MSLLSKVFSSGIGAVVDSIAGAADTFIQTPDEKAKYKIDVEKLLQKRDSEIEQTIRAELKVKQEILVAELQQGDSYTKRARPTVVYAGLVFIGINYVLFPILSRAASFFGVEGIEAGPLADLPTAFWTAWGGICATWSIGRSVEKRGVRHPVIGAITGSKGNLID